MTALENDPQSGLEMALRLAIHYHAGQRDKAGEAYMLHLLRVMHGCSTPESRQVALLHDVLEDTSATPEDLHRSGLGHDVIEAIRLLTKPIGMRYSEYILRLAADKLAREVKMADLQDNYRLDRVAYRPDHLQEDTRRIQRYILAFQFLRGDWPPDFFRARMLEVDDE